MTTNITGNCVENVCNISYLSEIEIAIESFRIGAFDYVIKNETQFKRIHYSLFNIFNLIKAEKDSNVYKNIVIAMVVSFVLLLGGVAALYYLPLL